MFLRSKLITTGLDIGSSSVKAVRLAQNGGTPTLLGLAVAEIGDVTADSEEIREARRERTIEAIRRALEGAGARLKRAIPVTSAIGGPQVSIKHVAFPRMSANDLATSAQWEAKKHVPFDTTNAVLGCEVLERADKDPKEQMQVVLTAAEGVVVNDHIALLQESGVVPDIIDIAPIALMNEVDEEGLIDGRAIAVMEIGCSFAHFSVYTAESLFFARSIPMPSETDAPRDDSGPACDDAGDDEGIVEGGDFTSTRWFRTALREIRFSLTFYNNETGRRGIEHIYLAGGRALTPGIAEAFTEALGVETEVLNPLERIQASAVELGDLLEQGPRFALAMGLARRS